MPSFPSGSAPLPIRTMILLKINSRHPSLQLKKVGRFWSVRVGSHYRALATEADGDLIWLWIGSHADYDALIR